MIGIVLGIVPMALLPALPERGATAALAGLSIVLLWWPSAAARLAAGFALGSALALAHGQVLLDRRLPEVCVKQPLELLGRVSSLPRYSTMPSGDQRQRFEFSLESVQPLRCSGPEVVLLSYYGEQQLIPGQRWRFSARLKRPWGLANPGSFNMQAWFALTAIDAVGSVRRGSEQQLAGDPDWRDVHHRLRLRVSRRIASLPMAPAVAAMLRAVTVADKSGIDARLWTLLQQFGINHLLVISGLHIALVAGVGYLLGGLLSRLAATLGCNLPALALLCSLGLALAYAALAGFSLATQRAVIMLACFIVARLCGRHSGSANNLLLAALLVLLVNPLAALGSGFWLSFGAVAFLLWLGHWLGGLHRLKRALYTHLLMSLAMLPLGAWWFGGSSLIAGLANLIMVPLVGLWVVPLALLAALFSLLAWPGEILLWQLAGFPLELLWPVAEDIASAGGAWIYRPLTPSALELMLALPAVLCLGLPLGGRLRLLVLIMLLPLLLPPSDRGHEADSVTRVSVLDVGQGSAVVVRAGKLALLYDTGGGDPAGLNMANTVILPYLRQAGITRLDTLVISHQDLDHSAGAGLVLESMPVDRYRYGGEPGVKARGDACTAGESWRWPGGQQFTMLAPLPGERLAKNDGSCVLLIELAGQRLLLPGDIEARRERQLVRRLGATLRSDWLLAGHHGSQTSSSWAFLKAVRPETVVISAGYANRFGHPHDTVLGRLQRRGTRVLATASGGALEFEFRAGKTPQVSRYRDRQRRYWM